jgi:hypothetical protein
MYVEAGKLKTTNSTKRDYHIHLKGSQSLFLKGLLLEKRQNRWDINSIWMVLEIV